ncbi:hypothetical protein BH11ACT3_BH11ACT3_17960 [soil metagenome]
MTFLSPEAEAALRALAALGPDAAPLERLSALRALSLALEAEPAVLQAVRDAQAGGASWDDIAAAAQLKAPAAKWRWQGSDSEIESRHAAGRKRSERPSSRPLDLPGLSVADAAKHFGVTAQAIYLRVSRGQLRSETVVLDDGRSYKRIFPE